MKISEIKELLRTEFDTQHYIRVVRKKVDNYPMECIPVVLGEKLVIVQYLYDFQIDGYKVLRIRDITQILAGECERFQEYILKKEGIYDQIKKPAFTSLNNWETFFRQYSLNKNIVIECEKIEDGQFYLGKIIEVYSNFLIFLRFDALCEWDQEPKKIFYKDVTSVSFEDRYTNILSKYVNQPT